MPKHTALGDHGGAKLKEYFTYLYLYNNIFRHLTMWRLLSTWEKTQRCEKDHVNRSSQIRQKFDVLPQLAILMWQLGWNQGPNSGKHDPDPITKLDERLKPPMMVAVEIGLVRDMSLLQYICFWLCEDLWVFIGIHYSRLFWYTRSPTSGFVYKDNICLHYYCFWRVGHDFSNCMIPERHHGSPE